MFSLLFQYFYDLFYLAYPETESSPILDDILGSASFSIPLADGTSIPFGDLGSYLAFICAFIALIIIIVLCCLFIGKIIKTISRLFMGA